MRKYFIGFLLGLFVATYGTEGVFKLIDGVTGIAKSEIDEIIEVK